jgi:hypothetical protein
VRVRVRVKVRVGVGVRVRVIVRAQLNTLVNSYHLLLNYLLLATGDQGAFDGAAHAVARLERHQ